MGSHLCACWPRLQHQSTTGCTALPATCSTSEIAVIHAENLHEVSIDPSPKSETAGGSPDSKRGQNFMSGIKGMVSQARNGRYAFLLESAACCACQAVTVLPQASQQQTGTVYGHYQPPRTCLQV